MVVKQCSKCGFSCDVEVAAQHFGRQQNGKYGFKSWCKNCVSEYKAVYRASHREELREKQAAYRASHRKELNVFTLQYRKSHPEKVHLWNVAYYAKHREEEKERNARNRRKNNKISR